MSSEPKGTESVLILRVRDDRVPDVVEALNKVDLGVTDDDAGGFVLQLGPRGTGAVRMTTIKTDDGMNTDSCIRDLA